jgi:hypothetical protein
MKIPKVHSLAFSGIAILLATSCGSDDNLTANWEQWHNASPDHSIGPENVKLTGSVDPGGTGAGGMEIAKSFAIEGAMHNPTKKPGVICVNVAAYQHGKMVSYFPLCNENKLGRATNIPNEDFTIQMIRPGGDQAILNYQNAGDMDTSPIDLKLENARIIFPKM